MSKNGEIKIRLVNIAPTKEITQKLYNDDGTSRGISVVQYAKPATRYYTISRDGITITTALTRKNALKFAKELKNVPETPREKYVKHLRFMASERERLGLPFRL